MIQEFFFISGYAKCVREKKKFIKIVYFEYKLYKTYFFLSFMFSKIEEMKLIRSCFER